jgi:opacity protein-like surface antigen
MKKILITMMALVVATGAFAQLNFGVKVGGNLATISGMTSEDNGLDFGDLAKVTPSQSMKVGFNVGAWAEYMVMPMLGVQVELNYSLQGVNTKVETSSSLLGAASTTDTSYGAGYVNVPILAKAHFANLAAYVGPQLGFATGFNYTSTVTTDDKATEYEPEAVEDYSGFDFSLVVGAQYKLTANIGVDARYNIGLTNVFPTLKNDEGEVTREGFGKQGVLQIGVFYQF